MRVVCAMCGVCSCYVAPVPPMTPRCPAEPAAAAHSCGQLRGKSAAAPRTAPALTSPLHNRDVPWPQPPHGQIWSRHRHRPGAADPWSGSEIFLWAFVNTTPEINYPLSPGRLVPGTSTWNFIPFEEIKITLVERATPSAEAGADHHSALLYLSTVPYTSDSTLPPYSLSHGPILLGLYSF